MNYVVFDIETYSPSGNHKIDTQELRASVVGAYYSWIDTYIAFMESDVPTFLYSLTYADIIVGYNHLWFDFPVLQKYSNFDLLQLPSYDIMLEIEKKLGFKAKLDDVAKANLGEQKTDSYEQFKHYYEQKNWIPLIDYCMNDVRITKLIFQNIVNGIQIKYNDLLEVKEVILDLPKKGDRLNLQQASTLF